MTSSYRHFTWAPWYEPVLTGLEFGLNRSWNRFLTGFVLLRMRSTLTRKCWNAQCSLTNSSATCMTSSTSSVRRKIYWRSTKRRSTVSALTKSIKNVKQSQILWKVLKVCIWLLLINNEIKMTTTDQAWVNRTKYLTNL